MALIKRYETPICGNYKKGVLKYGSLTGILLCIVVMVRMLLFVPIKQPITYVEDIALLICMFVCTYLYRKKLQGGTIYFKEVYLLNLGIGIVSALIYGIFIIIYAQSIDTDLCQRYFELQEAVLKKGNFTSGELTAKIEELKYITPRTLGAMSFILTTVLSFILAMIVGLFMRTQKNIVRPSKKN